MRFVTEEAYTIERQSMKCRGSIFSECLVMFGSGISLVAVPAVFGEFPVVAIHHAIARDLGQDGCSGDGGGFTIPFDKGKGG